MPLLNTGPSSGTTSPAPPELPEGWHYTEDLVWENPYAESGRRRFWLPVLVAVLVVAGAVGLVLLNAAMHYSRGVAALKDDSYAQAASEFSAAKLLVLPYRDAETLAGQARRDLLAEGADEQKSQARLQLVTGALEDATTRLDAEDAPGVLAALQALRAGDVRAALRDSVDAREVAATLRLGLAAAAKAALSGLEWGRAGNFAAALLLLEPSSADAAALAAKAQTGEELSSRLARAKAAAHNRNWRRALRLALAVTAVREGFPGAAAVIADARRALAPKPKPKPKPAVAAAATSTTPSTSSGGTSSGSSSQPPPP